MSNNYKRFIAKAHKKRVFILSTFALVIFLLGLNIEFSLYKIVKGLPSMYNLIERMLSPNVLYIQEVLSKLVETIEIAIVSSLIGVMLSIPLALLTARNIGPNPVLATILNGALSLLRTIPNLIWAALLVSVFSIGKLPGLIALTLTAVLVSTKLLKEHIETINENSINGVRSVGSNQIQVFRYCVLPVISEIVISVLFMVFEINIRSATVLGLVGAGGIGQIMWRDLNHLRYDNISTIVLALFITILSIDLMSFLARNAVKNCYIQHGSLKTYKAHIHIKNGFFLLVVASLIVVNSNIISISMERLKMGVEQGLFIIRGMTAVDFSYLPALIKGLLTSLTIAIFATIVGGIGALILSFFTANNIAPNKGLSVVLKMSVNILRTFPPIITAIIFFRGVGPGPLAGAMALSVYTTGVLTKLYSEVIESTHENIKSSIEVTGCSNLNCFRHGILPHTFPAFISLLLYRLESNIRNSTILGIIGAGGVGTILTINITWRNWGRVGLLILGIASMIMTIDWLSHYFRRKLC